MPAVEGKAVQVNYAQPAAPVQIESVQGSMRRTLPKDAGFDLEADLQTADQLTSAASFSLPPPDGNDDEGHVNGGGPLVSIEPVSAPIELRAR